MAKTDYALYLQPSLKSAAERIAAADGASLNQFINVAVAEKIAAIEAETYFSERVGKSSRDAFLVFLGSAGDMAPDRAADE